MNIIYLSKCGRSVEFWRNGRPAYIVPIQDSLADVVGTVCYFARTFHGCEPTIDAKLLARLDAANADVTRMASGLEY